MVCNTSMSTSIHADRELIDRLGGSAKVACILGFKKDGGTQRVENWKKRGIPSHIKVQRPEIFMVDMVANQSKAPASQSQVAINSEARQVAQGVA